MALGHHSQHPQVKDTAASVACRVWGRLLPMVLHLCQLHPMLRELLPSMMAQWYATPQYAPAIYCNLPSFYRYIKSSFPFLEQLVKLPRNRSRAILPSVDLTTAFPPRSGQSAGLTSKHSSFSPLGPTSSALSSHPPN